MEANMTDYSKYTDEQLKQAKNAIQEQIWCNECGNDCYYSSSQYKSDRAALREVEREIEFREDKRTNGQIFDEIMGIYMKAGA